MLRLSVHAFAGHPFKVKPRVDCDTIKDRAEQTAPLSAQPFLSAPGREPLGFAFLWPRFTEPRVGSHAPRDVFTPAHLGPLCLPGSLGGGPSRDQKGHGIKRKCGADSQSSFCPFHGGCISTHTCLLYFLSILCRLLQKARGSTEAGERWACLLSWLQQVCLPLHLFGIV